MLAKPYEPQILLDQIRRILAEGKRAANRPLKGEAEE
jgi:hypothetical protein